MGGLGALGFTAPWLLAGLIGLPLLWWLLRAVPPAPVRRAFAGVALLIGLADKDAETARTPWWLLALRLLAVAAMILGFAGPVLNPDASAPGSGPLVVVIDDGWAAAPDWTARLAAAETQLKAAQAAGRRALVVPASAPPEGLAWMTAGEAAASLPGLVPKPYWVGHAALQAWAAELRAPVETLWLSDGLDSADRVALAERLRGLGPLTVLEPPRPRLGLRPVRIEDGLVRLEAVATSAPDEMQIAVVGIGPDPAGIARELVRATLSFAPGESLATADLSLPPELRNRITRFEIEGERAAGAVSLADDSLRRRKVGLVAGAAAGREGLELLAPEHFLREALVPTADLVEGTIADILSASPDVITLVDVAALAPADAEALKVWVAEGGLLLRFAGPRMAASDVGRGEDDPLLPVRLRAGGRDVGGAMSWGAPRALAPFPETSPFHGLSIPEEVTVTSQVLAEPGPDLAARTIASLADATPLVTRKALGDGQVVLVHVSANAEWSGLPLSGLFVQMLERLAISTRAAGQGQGELAGLTWEPRALLDGFGALAPAGTRAGVAGEALSGPASAALPAGVYGAEARLVAVNVLGAGAALSPAVWPSGVVPSWQGAARERDLAGPVLALALGLLALDILASLAVSGRLYRGALAGLAIVAMLSAGGMPIGAARAQAGAGDPAVEPAIIAAAAEVTLAYVRTGDTAIDRVSQAGLTGLSEQVRMRSSVEPAPPVGVDIETDELAVYPILYWPVTAAATLPTPAAYAKLNRYLATGGMIVFDTRDGGVAGYGGAATPEGARLRSLARPLDIPPLAPIPEDHVLTRTFYLLADFPGRFQGQPVWVEAARPDAEQAEGMPFRNLNDGVSPVILGGNDWAGAWAVDDAGRPMLPVGRGYAGERQREMAYRFGVNLVMHVLTGNYKSDQVHVPALLERLGQ